MKQLMRTTTFLLACIFLFGCGEIRGQWIELDSLESAIAHISTSKGNLYVCTATSGVYISTDNGNSFHKSNSGLYNLNTRVILAKDSILILGTNNSIYKSNDCGSSWSLSNNGFPSTSSNVEDIIWKGDSILVATYGSGIYFSKDTCQTWFPLNNGFLDLFRSCLISYGSRVFTGTMYGGSGIYITDNDGISWEQRNNGVPFDPFAPSKYVSITSFTSGGSIVFASTFGCNILQTVNNGEMWIKLNCPNNYIWKTMYIEDIILCGHNGGGVTKSNDMGNTWEFINEGLITSSDRDIRTFCLFRDYVYTGTWSRKVYRRPISELITNLPEININHNIAIYPNPCSSHTTIQYSITEPSLVTIEIFDQTGRHMETICQEQQPSGLRQAQWNAEGYATGIYFYRVRVNGRAYTGKIIKLD